MEQKDKTQEVQQKQPGPLDVGVVILDLNQIGHGLKGLEQVAELGFIGETDKDFALNTVMNMTGDLLRAVNDAGARITEAYGEEDLFKGFYARSEEEDQ